MTKRAHRRRDGLLAPRRPKHKPLAQRYGHVLDSTVEEIMPAVRPAPVDRPTVRADHLLLTGPLFAYLEALITSALAHSGALNTDEDPRDVLCEAAGLSHLEYQSVVMRSENCSWDTIARSQAVTAGEARSAAAAGVKKLRRFVED